MKSIFRSLKSLALVALVGVAALAVSCEPAPTPDGPEPNDTVKEAYEFVDGSNVFFDAGEKKSVAVKEGQTLEGATVVASPEGWSVAVVGNSLEITAPAEDAEGAEAYGDVELKLEGEEKIYEGKLSVFVGQIISVEMVSNSFKDVEVKAVIAGMDEYLVHLGTNGEWQSSFDEWKNTVDGWNPIEFGWDGEYFGKFEGSLFTFAKNPYKSNFQPVPGTKYQLAILPLVEGKAVVDYKYEDIVLYDFETIEAGENGNVTPTLALESRSHAQVAVTIDATGAYATYYAFYSDNDMEAIPEDKRESVIKKDVIKNGTFATESTFVVKANGLEENENVYLAAISIDENGNYGGLAFEQYTTDTFKFNEDAVITLGEITCSGDGKTVYVPVESVEGCEVAQWRYYYVNDSSSAWWLNLSRSVEKAELLIATAPNEYYGPQFVEPEELEDNTFVITSGPSAGALAHIFVMAIDTNGMPSHAAYAEFTPTDTAVPVLYKDDEGYEYGMPTITYKDVTKGLKGEEVIYTVNFNVTLAAETNTAWVALADEAYTIGRTPYRLLEEMMTGNFMYAQAYTTDGVFEGDILYAQNDEEGDSAVYVAWKDNNGKYHETKLFYEPVAEAQDDVKKAWDELNK
ncbi:MAG: hypothetical protein IJZ09_03985 [Tidjanibacter sp.]|nr:hypothetical protein [Tidjanibacter sp.]